MYFLNDSLLPNLVRHPELPEIMLGEDAGLRIDRRKGREECDDRKQHPLKEHIQVARPMIDFRLGWERQERERYRDEKPGHRESHEKLSDERKIVCQNALSEGVTTKPEREPAEKCEHE